MVNTPMDFETFKYYMDRLKEEYDWREAMCKLDIDMTEHMDTFYYTIDLLSFIFNDAEGMLPEYIFEGEWGTNPTYLSYNGAHTLEDIYTLLLKNYMEVTNVSRIES